MELIDRYLQAVEFWLPRKQKKDIIAELSEDIYAEVEEQEIALGRKLNEAEAGAILKRRGSPVLVANRYLPQQHLIGPVLFPIYVFVLKVVALFYLIPWMVVGTVLLVFDYHRFGQGGHGWISLLSSWWQQVFAAAAIITLAFAVLERAQSKGSFLEKWDPLKLPPVRDANLITRSSSYIEVVVNLGALAWWTINMRSPVVLNIFDLQIWLAPVWSYFFWGFLALMLLNTGLAAANLSYPYWTVRKAAFRLLSDCAGSFLFAWLLRANIVTEFVAESISHARAVELANAINWWSAQMFPLAIVLGVVIAVVDIVRIMRLRGPKEHQAGAAAVLL